MVLEYQRMSKCQETLTLNEVAETMIEIIFANQDVLLPAICWLFVDLMIYPQYIELIDWTNIDDRMINKSDLESIHKDLLCIITESARVHPFFPLSFPEILHKEIKLGGYTLPEGTHVCIDQYSLNHNSNYWQKPNEFQPERFYEVDDFTKKWGSFRFGFGGRRCPGQHYANLILANAVARLFSKYQLVPIDIDDVSDHTKVPLVWPGALTMIPNVKIKLHKKEEQTNCLNDNQFNVINDTTESDKKVTKNDGLSSQKDVNNKCDSGFSSASEEMDYYAEKSHSVEKKNLGISMLATDIIQPIYHNGSNFENLLCPGVMVGISTLPKSPLLCESGTYIHFNFKTCKNCIKLTTVY